MASLTKEGATVFFGGRRADKGEEVALATKATFHAVDVANEESNKAFFHAASLHFEDKKVDFIFLNAGVEGNSNETLVQTMDIKTYDYVYNVNVRGIVLGLQFGTPLLGKGGSFVFTSSVGSVIAFGGNPVYASSKAAVDGLARSYAAQFAAADDERLKSLSVVTVNPTVYVTEMVERFSGGESDVKEGLAKMLNPSQRLGKAEELAGLMCDFVRGDLPYGNGDSFVVDVDTHFPLSEYGERMQKVKA